jgi:hypothetical protein
MRQLRKSLNLKPVVLTVKDRRRGVDGLRYDARLAYLDGRKARALYWNRKADALAREIAAASAASTPEART